MVTDLMTEIEQRCDAIEECYEFLLAYAAKGVPNDDSGQVRDHLRRAARALSGLAHCLAEIARKHRLEPIQKYQSFLSVLDGDAGKSLAALELVLAQSVISSQLIDNLNASIHLRALLTDLFLIDSIFTEHAKRNSALTI